MKNYETLMDELTRLNIQKQAVLKQIHEIEEQVNAIKKEKAEALYKEISERFSELVYLGYRIDVSIWENEYGRSHWHELEDNSGDYRLRHKDEAIVG